VTLILAPLAALGLCGYAAWRLYLRSRAYQAGNPLFYRHGRPNVLGRVFNALTASLAARGAGPASLVTLETIGYRTGRPHRVPVAVTTHGESRFIVSMLGERSPWVRNLRRSAGHAVLVRRSREEVELVEVPADARAVILREFVRHAPGARPHLRLAVDAPLEEFGRLAPSFPVFRVERFPIGR
jgi:deazaflavin-dependent oxidoreductase (nitroreductase family)